MNRKSIRDDVKNTIVTIRFSKREIELIKENIAQGNFNNISEYIRRLSLHKFTIPRESKEKILREENLLINLMEIKEGFRNISQLIENKDFALNFKIENVIIQVDDVLKKYGHQN